MLGRPARALQIGANSVTVTNAARVLRAYERLRMASPSNQLLAQQQLAELRDEHYRLERIQREVDQLAAQRGWPAPCINPTPRGGRWPGPTGLTDRAAVLIGAVHAALVFEEAEG